MTDDDREFLERVSKAYGQVGPIDPAARAEVIRSVEADALRVRRTAWTVSPGWLSAAAAALLIVGVGLGWTLRSMRAASAPAEEELPAELSTLSATSEVRIVQFVLTAPRASSVTVVGDFNGWDPGATPMRRRDTGAWVAAIPVQPGRHLYAFIVDGDRWIPDPAAPLAPEDGFGIRNSVIVVGDSDAT